MSMDIEKFIEGLHLYLQKELTPLFERVGELEKKVGKIEEKGIYLRGVFRQGEEYVRGDVVTDRGALWACTNKTMERPPSHSWVLISKSR